MSKINELCGFYLRIIQSVEIFAALVALDSQSNDNTVPGEIMFRRENFAMFVAVREPETFPGQLVEAGSGLTIDNIDFNRGRFINSTSNTDIIRSLASVNISRGLFEMFENTTPMNELPRLIFTVYNISSSFYQDPTGNGTGGVILSVLRSPLQGPAPTNLNEQVQFQFQANQVPIANITE